MYTLPLLEEKLMNLLINLYKLIIVIIHKLSFTLLFSPKNNTENVNQLCKKYNLFIKTYN